MSNQNANIISISICFRGLQLIHLVNIKFYPSTDDKDKIKP